MYIRRKVFSVLDTEVGERLFSTTDYILDQREFAEDENVKSPRGDRRHRFGFSDALGVYAGKKYAEELDREGKSDEEIIKGSRNRAALVGGGLGAVEGAGAAALGAYLGTSLGQSIAKKAAKKYGKKLIRSGSLSPVGVRRLKYALRYGVPSAMKSRGRKIVGGAAAGGALIGAGISSAIAAHQAKKDTKERLENSRA